MKERVIQSLPTFFAYAAPIQDQHTSIPEIIYIDKIFPRAEVQEKRATLDWTFEPHTIFHGNKLPLVEDRE